MEAIAAAATPELINIQVTDWRRQRRAHLDGVPRNATVREILTEAQRVLDISEESSFQLLHGDRALNHMETLAEAGIDTDAVLDAVPEVDAGR